MKFLSKTTDKNMLIAVAVAVTVVSPVFLVSRAFGSIILQFQKDHCTVDLYDLEQNCRKEHPGHGQ